MPKKVLSRKTEVLLSQIGSVCMVLAIVIFGACHIYEEIFGPEAMRRQAEAVRSQAGSQAIENNKRNHKHFLDVARESVSRGQPEYAPDNLPTHVKLCVVADGFSADHVETLIRRLHDAGLIAADGNEVNTIVHITRQSETVGYYAVRRPGAKPSPPRGPYGPSVNAYRDKFTVHIIDREQRVVLRAMEFTNTPPETIKRKLGEKPTGVHGAFPEHSVHNFVIGRKRG